VEWCIRKLLFNTLKRDEKGIVMTEIEMPGQAGIKRRDLHFFWVLDASASMTGSKIYSLNHAIREALPAMQAEAALHPEVNLLVRVVTFGYSVKWHVPTPTPVAQFQHLDVQPDGSTPMGEALGLVANAMAGIRGRNVPPVIVVVTDGQPTDNFEDGLAKLMATEYGPKSIRLGIAIGADAKHEPLLKFINNAEYPVLDANNPAAVAACIKWVSTIAVKAASNPRGAEPIVPPAVSSGAEVWID